MKLRIAVAIVAAFLLGWSGAVVMAWRSQSAQSAGIPPYLPAVLENLQSKDYSVRLYALEIIAERRIESAEALPLVSAIMDEAREFDDELLGKLANNAMGSLKGRLPPRK